VILEEDPVFTFLEHHGVKGQKWGVRRKQARIGRQIKRQQRSVDVLRRVAEGKGRFRDKAAVGLQTSLLDLVNEGNLQGVAQDRLDRQQRIQKDISRGKRKVRALLLKSYGIHVSELNYKYKR
jgi:hypothetical protein